jgi:ATP-dependent Clp protease ATP-binding subunit ClpC
VDEIVVFKPLLPEEIRQILGLLLAELSTRLAAKGVALEVSQAARDSLAERGYEPAYGARPMRRLIQSEIEDRLAEEMLSGRLGPGSIAKLGFREGRIVLSAHRPELKAIPGVTSIAN